MRFQVFSMVSIFLLSIALPMISAAPVIKNEFEFSQTDITLYPGLNETTAIPHFPGYRPQSATLDWELSPDSQDYEDTINVGLSHSQLGTTHNLTGGSGGLSLNSSFAGPSTAGSVNLHLFNSTTMQGFKSYDTLQLSCGIISCGSITATANLTIHANNVILDASTSISGNYIITSNTGDGGAGSASSSWVGYAGGGAGHAAAGGAGGDSSGNGGTSYGNGTESGSAGGSVSHTGASNTVGGYGGTVITIVAGSVEINGTLSSLGGDGDAGPSAPNGGNGGNAAGGGSGGSINVKANTISIGQSGTVSASGGDGGDGADGHCPAGNPCLFLYHGGDGGGGGAGGFVNLITTSGGLSNSGTVSVIEGFGGDFGLKYGTGSDGLAGSDGGNGTVSFSTFSGFVSASNVSSDEGWFLIPDIGPGDGEIEQFAWLNSSATIPSGSSLDFFYNYTMDNSTWSGWIEGNITNQMMPRFSNLHLLYDFQRSSSGAAPILRSLTYGITFYDSLENLSIELEGNPILGPIPEYYGLIEDGGSNVTATGVELWIDVPLYGQAVTDLHMWLAIYNTSQITGNIVGSFDSGVSMSWNFSDIEAGGIDIIIPASSLNSNWPTTANNTVDQITWARYNFTLSLPTQTSFDISNYDIQYISFYHTIADSINFTSQMNAHALSACGTWYQATSFCLQEFEITSSGDPPNGGEWNQTLILNNLNIVWIDDIPPQILTLSHLVNTVDSADARNGDIIVIVATDINGEDNLLGRIWVHDNPVSNISELLSTPNQSLGYSVPASTYWTSIQTNTYDPTITHELWVSLEMTDVEGNIAILLNGDSVKILPVLPKVGSLTIANTDGDAISWMLPASTTDEIVFSVTDFNNRTDLDVEIDLTGPSSTITIPMPWDNNTNSYTATWLSSREKMGDWELEIVASEFNSGITDSDGLQVGVDAHFSIVDFIPPKIVSAVSSDEGSYGRIDVEWLSEENEIINSWVSIYNETDAFIDTGVILHDTDNSGHVTITTEQYAPGDYWAVVHVKDDQNNEVNQTIFFVNIPAPLPEVNSSNINLEVIGESIHASGNVVFRSGNGMLMWLVNGQEVANISINDGIVETNISLSQMANGTHEVELLICSIEICQVWNQTVDSSSWWIISTSHLCVDANCTITNLGENNITTRMKMNSVSSYFICSGEKIGTTNETISHDCTVSNSTPVGNHTLDWSLEVQDRSGYWLLIKQSTTTFSVVEQIVPENESNNPSDSNNDESNSGSDASSATIYWIIGAFAVAIVGILVFVMFGRTNDDIEFEEDNSGDYELIKAAEEPVEIQNLTPRIVDSWESLPPDGEYHNREDGMWYQDAEAGWWWQHPDGRFELV